MQPVSLPITVRVKDTITHAVGNQIRNIILIHEENNFITDQRLTTYIR